MRLTEHLDMRQSFNLVASCCHLAMHSSKFGARVTMQPLYFGFLFWF